MSRDRSWWKSSRIRAVRRRISDALQAVGYPIARLAARAWVYTLRHWVRWSESGPLPEFMDRGDPVVVCAWHQDILPSMAYLITQGTLNRGYPLVLMVSDGRAGSLGGTTVAANGVRVVMNSKHRDGGRVGLVQRLSDECQRTRTSAIFTGDGSRGPAFQARWGAVYLARDTGFPIVPVRTQFTRGATLRRTWARFMLPALPGHGRAHAATGEPLYVPADADKAVLEECRQELERRLNALIPVAEAALRVSGRETDHPASPEVA